MIQLKSKLNDEPILGLEERYNRCISYFMALIGESLISNHKVSFIFKLKDLISFHVQRENASYYGFNYQITIDNIEIKEERMFLCFVFEQIVGFYALKMKEYLTRLNTGAYNNPPLIFKPLTILNPENGNSQIEIDSLNFMIDLFYSEIKIFTKLLMDKRTIYFIEDDILEKRLIPSNQLIEYIFPNLIISVDNFKFLWDSESNKAEINNNMDQRFFRLINSEQDQNPDYVDSVATILNMQHYFDDILTVIISHEPHNIFVRHFGNMAFYCIYKTKFIFGKEETEVLYFFGRVENVNEVLGLRLDNLVRGYSDIPILVSGLNFKILNSNTSPPIKIDDINDFINNLKDFFERIESKESILPFQLIYGYDKSMKGNLPIIFTHSFNRKGFSENVHRDNIEWSTEIAVLQNAVNSNHDLNLITQLEDQQKNYKDFGDFWELICDSNNKYETSFGSLLDYIIHYSLNLWTSQTFPPYPIKSKIIDCYSYYDVLLDLFIPIANYCFKKSMFFEILYLIEDCLNHYLPDAYKDATADDYVNAKIKFLKKVCHPTTFSDFMIFTKYSKFEYEESNSGFECKFVLTLSPYLFIFENEEKNKIIIFNPFKPMNDSDLKDFNRIYNTDAIIETGNILRYDNLHYNYIVANNLNFKSIVNKIGFFYDNIRLNDPTDIIEKNKGFKVMEAAKLGNIPTLVGMDEVDLDWSPKIKRKIPQPTSQPAPQPTSQPAPQPTSQDWVQKNGLQNLLSGEAYVITGSLYAYMVVPPTRPKFEKSLKNMGASIFGSFSAARKKGYKAILILGKEKGGIKGKKHQEALTYSNPTIIQYGVFVENLWNNIRQSPSIQSRTPIPSLREIAGEWISYLKTL